MNAGDERGPRAHEQAVHELTLPPAVRRPPPCPVPSRRIMPYLSRHVPSNVEASQSAGERRVRLRLAFGGTFVAVSGWLRATDSLLGRFACGRW